VSKPDVLSRPFPTRLNVKFLLFLSGKNERNWELVQHEEQLEEEENNALCNYLVPVPPDFSFVWGSDSGLCRIRTFQNNAPDLPTNELRTNSNCGPVERQGAGAAAAAMIPPRRGIKMS
jgi:hypothetical protein